MAGKKWLYAFRRRNPDISLRAPESTSYARATGFNKPAVEKFYVQLDLLIQKHGLNGSRIFNCDESGMKTVQQQHAKVLAKTGKRQVGSLTSAERGKNVTVICTMSACGVFIPPCFVFPRKRCNPLLMDNAPESAKGFFNETGWMTAEVFKDYLHHFIEFVKPSTQKPVLLIADGHASHTKSLNVIDLASSSGVILLSLPPHTTHRLQPLDVGFFKPLQTYYDRYIDRWLKLHPGRVFTEYQVAEAFREAYGKAATVEIATNAYRKCGIWPFNAELFSEADYAPSATTDRPAVDGQPVTVEPEAVIPASGAFPSASVEPAAIAGPSVPPVTVEPAHDSPISSASSSASVEPAAGESVIDPLPSTSVRRVSLSELCTLPQAPSKTTKRRAGQSSTILTDSPYKRLLQSKSPVAKSKENANKGRKTKAACKGQAQPESVTSRPKPKNKRVTKKTAVVSSDEDEEWPCLVCCEPFKNSKKGEKWIRCVTCERWAHLMCTGLDNKAKTYVCDNCNSDDSDD